MYSTDRPVRYGRDWEADVLPGSKGPTPLTANTLRALRLGERLSKARRGMRDVLEQVARTTTGATASRAVDEADLWRGRGRQPDHGPEHYAKVAEVYRKAWLEGRPPTKAVEKKFGVSYSYAAKKVQKARELGFLPATTRGRAGASTAGKRRRKTR